MVTPIQATWVLLLATTVSQAAFSVSLLILLLLLGPEALEVIRVSQVDGNANDICIFHGLPDLDVFIGEHLDLLAIVPKGRVEAVQENGRLGTVDVLERYIVSLVAEADEDLFEVGWVVCF